VLSLYGAVTWLSLTWGTETLTVVSFGSRRLLMADKWNGIWSGTVEGRPVIVEKYDESEDLRVRTTQQGHAPGTVSQDGDSTVFPASVWEGDAIQVEAVSRASLVEALIRDGAFTLDGATEIVSHIP
jgi:hypothetical protein